LRERERDGVGDFDERSVVFERSVDRIRLSSYTSFSYLYFLFFSVSLFVERVERERDAGLNSVCVCVSRKKITKVYIYKDREDVASYMGNR